MDFSRADSRMDRSLERAEIQEIECSRVSTAGESVFPAIFG